MLHSGKRIIFGPWRPKIIAQLYVLGVFHRKHPFEKARCKRNRRASSPAMPSGP